MYTRLCGIIKTNTLENPGCFCFSGKCGGESACVGAVLGKRGSGILTRLTGDARELPPAGAVQPVSTGFLKSVPLCGTPQLFTVACGHNPAYAGRCGGTSASLKCGRELCGSPHKRPPPKMRRKGEVDGTAGVTAFFHRGLCPLCGGGFRRCRFETLLFTPHRGTAADAIRPAACIGRWSF